MKKVNIKLLIAVSIHFIITFFTDKFIFDTRNLDLGNYIICKVILLIVLIFLWNFIFKLLKRDKEYLKYFKYFIIYFIPLLILFIIFFPGTWYGSDVFNFAALSFNAKYLYYLNYLSSVFYIVSYMIFPFTSGVVALLALLFAIVHSYILKNMYDIFKTKLIYLFSIPFLLMHTLFYVFYPNRPIMFGILYLLLISMLFIDYLKKENLTTKKLIFLAILTGLVSFWRSESIYLILSIPIFIFIIYKQKINFKNIFKILGICVLSFIIISFPQKLDEYKNKTDIPSSRNLPMYVSPLSYMLTMELKGENLEEDLEIINKVLDINLMKKYASFFDTPSVWSEGGCIKNYTKKEYYDFQKAYIRVIKNNFDLFLKTKIYTFDSAAGYHGDSFTSMNLYSANDQIILQRLDTKSIVDYKIRKTAYSIIEGKTNFNLYNKIYLYTQNLLIPLLFILIFFIYSVLKKNLFYFLISGMLLGHTLLVFLTAPAAYFMYYFNIYLCGWFIGGFLIINLILNKINKKIN